MIITKITGGVGNQLFQYAVGRAVAMHHQVPLKLDITGFTACKIHNGYRLDQFYIDADVASLEEIAMLKGASYFFCRVLRKAGLIKNKTYYGEKQRTIYDPAVFTENARYLDGYWQNEQYFLDIRETLVKEFSPNEGLSSQAYIHQSRMQNTTAVSIHVRRGDYINHPDIGVLDLDYYQSAVGYMKEKLENPVFFVFSNEIDWCKKNLGFLENSYYIADTESEIDDLVLMSKCQHNIIANSSFSWWAAWLNQNPHKIVIAPRKWMSKNPNHYRWSLNTWIEF